MAKVEADQPSPSCPGESSVIASGIKEEWTSTEARKYVRRTDDIHDVLYVVFMIDALIMIFRAYHV